MRHWWTRSPAEQAALQEWATRELRELELQRRRQVLEDERASYHAKRCGPKCARCEGTGRAVIVVSQGRGLPVGRTVPCPTCRPEDAQVLVEQLRAGAA